MILFTSAHLPVFGEKYVYIYSGQIETPIRFEVESDQAYIVTDCQRWTIEDWRDGFYSLRHVGLMAQYNIPCRALRILQGVDVRSVAQ